MPPSFEKLEDVVDLEKEKEILHRSLHWGVPGCNRFSYTLCFLDWVRSVLRKEKDNYKAGIQIIHKFASLPAPNLNMKANLITKTNNLLAITKGKYHPIATLVKQCLSLTKEEKAKRDRNLEFARFQKAEHCIRFDKNQIKNVVLRFSHSDEWPQRAIAIALATGLRQQEILKTAKIPKIDGTHIWLTGLLKKRDVKETYSRPTLFLTPKEVKTLLEELQTGEAQSVLSSAAGKALGKVVKRTFGDDWNFHRLRAAYCNLSFQELATTESLPCWIHKVLNHSSNTMINALFYCNVKPVQS